MPKRTTEKVIGQLRCALQGNRFDGETFLPAERVLTEQFGVSRTSLRCALKELEVQGFIQAVPRHGYRILTGAANDPACGCPLTVVMRGEETLDASRGGFSQGMLNQFEKVADARSINLLGLSAKRLTPEAVMTQIQAARAWGVAIDGIDTVLFELLQRERIPFILFDDWLQDPPCDTIAQDDVTGGQLAIRYLIGRGRQHIAWFGHHYQASMQSRGRYAGALLELTGAGMHMEYNCYHTADKQEKRQQARELLTATPRPTGILALWRDSCRVILEVAQELGLKYGRDYDIVGWCPEELSLLDSRFALGLPQPAYITWSMRSMAEHAVARLLERRNNLGLPGNRVTIPVRLCDGMSAVSESRVA